ncbi:ATP-binding cassette domain-containing protein, partial [Aeromonas hydrophila]
GAGKSTFIKMLSGSNPPLSGKLEVSAGVSIGYFAQHQLETLRLDDSPLDHLVRLAPDKTEQELRNYLGSFGFHGDKALDKVAPFSGGEKARLVLALITWQKPNLLLLDEPTNHLDLEMRHALTMALQGFEGAMVVVSHDRHLLRTTTDDFYLVHGGRVEPFDGDLDDYHKWLGEQEKEANAKPDDGPVSANSAVARKDQKRREAEFRQATRPLRQKLEKLETSMEKLQAKLAAVEEQLADPAIYEESAKQKLSELLKSQGPIKEELEGVELEWMSLSEELETMEQAFLA